MKKNNLVGNYFGQLKVIKYVGNSKYLCECKCGNLTEVRTCNLTNGHTQSCGCLAKKKSAENGRKLLKDLTNQEVGNLKIIKCIPEMKKWECQCKCGNVCYVSQSNLTRKNGTKSCGCLVSLTKANEVNIVQGTNVGNIKRNTALPNSTTGIKSVHYSKTQGLYIATIGFQGKQYYLVFSTDINICINARKNAEKQIYSNFLEWYENRKKNRELN